MTKPDRFASEKEKWKEWSKELVSFLAAGNPQVREATASVFSGFIRLVGPAERRLTLSWTHAISKKKTTGKQPTLAERHASVLALSVSCIASHTVMHVSMCTKSTHALTYTYVSHRRWCSLRLTTFPNGSRLFWNCLHRS